MKKIQSLLIGGVGLAAAALVGCGGSDSENETPVPETTNPPAASSTVTDEVNRAASDAANQVSAEVRRQTDEVVARVQSETQTMFNELKQELTTGAQAKSDELLQSLGGDLSARVEKLAASLKGNESLMQTLNGAVQSLMKKDDAEAVGSFNELKQAGLTPEQTAVLKDTYNVAAAFVTQRNFAGLEGSESQVAQIVTSLRDGNFASALQPAQQIWANASLSAEQKEIFSGVFDQYAPGWRDAAGTVQKGLDALKGFGQ